MALDRIVGIVFLAISLAYGFATLDYPLLPFERNMVFLPTTLPKALSVVAIILALLLILRPKHKAGDAEAESDVLTFRQIRAFKLAQALALVAAMVIYALVLRPVGFVGATVLFIVATGWTLGERKLHIMVPIALFAAFFVWYLVQELLGVYLKPWPWFIAL